MSLSIRHGYSKRSCSHRSGSPYRCSSLPMGTTATTQHFQALDNANGSLSCLCWYKPHAPTMLDFNRDLLLSTLIWPLHSPSHEQIHPDNLRLALLACSSQLHSNCTHAWAQLLSPMCAAQFSEARWWFTVILFSSECRKVILDSWPTKNFLAHNMLAWGYSILLAAVGWILTAVLSDDIYSWQWSGRCGIKSDTDNGALCVHPQLTSYAALIWLGM